MQLRTLAQITFRGPTARTSESGHPADEASAIEAKRPTIFLQVQMTTEETLPTMDFSCTTESLHKHLAVNFGKESLQLTRTLERIGKKISDSRNHLRFNLRCRQNRIIPKCLQQKALEPGYTAKNLQLNYVMKILNQRIRRLNRKITNLEEESEATQQKLKQIVTDEMFQKILAFTETSQLKQHKKSKERQIKKFQNLIKHKQSAPICQKEAKFQCEDKQTPSQENWIKNLSNRDLTQTEKNVLAKGLNFSVTPTTIPTTDYITAVESAIRNNKLTGAEADDLRLSVTSSLKTAKPPPSNITVEERKALASLQKDENITILPADKGRCTVILNTTDYDSKLTDLLSDNKTYEKLKGDPTNKYKNKVIKSLQKLEKEGVIDKQLYYKLYPGEATPSIYGLPKIHKKDVPLRPIVSGIDSVTYNIAKHLTLI